MDDHNKQTTNQTDQQTNKQTHNKTNNQTNNQTKKRERTCTVYKVLNGLPTIGVAGSIQFER